MDLSSIYIQTSSREDFVNWLVFNKKSIDRLHIYQLLRDGFVELTDKTIKLQSIDDAYEVIFKQLMVDRVTAYDNSLKVLYFISQAVHILGNKRQHSTIQLDESLVKRFVALWTATNSRSENDARFILKLVRESRQFSLPK